MDIQIRLLFGKSAWEVIERNREMSNKNGLLAQLENKVNKEYMDYINSLYDLDAGEIIKSSYKTIIFEEFKNILAYDAATYFDEWKISNLLEVENLLELLYIDWLKFEDSVYDEYREFVFGYWSWDYFKGGDTKCQTGAKGL